jgi:hypothetical protein
MAQSATIIATPATMTDLDKIMSALAVQPTARQSALITMVIQVCGKNGVDYAKLSAGMKSSWTRRVKTAAESAGITF